MPGLSPLTPGIVPLFVGSWDRNVTFIVDLSEDMFPALGSVKQWLTKTLLTKASLRDSLFNILAFSHKVTKWSERVVTCSPDTAYEAMCWIHSLSCSPGRDLTGALSTAFSDPACQAVHLVTNGLPDDSEGLFRCLQDTVRVRPVHVFYLSDTCCPDNRMHSFLQRLTQATGGSCHILTLSATGAVEKVCPLYLPESSSSMTAWSGLKHCSVRAVLNRPLSCSLCAPLVLCPYRCSLGHPGGECPVSMCVRARGGSTEPSAFTIGSRVLARRELDQFYYLGTIREELQGRKGVYLVEFDRLPLESGSCLPALQLTSSWDLVPYTLAHERSLGPGDKVLAPWEPSLARYGPGSVIQGFEIRDPLRGRNENGIQVLFWNGCQVRVPGEVAVWIPASLHERILLELQRPPCSHSHAHAHSCLARPHCALCPAPSCLAPAHHCPGRDWWGLASTHPHATELDAATPKFSREELERRVDAQLKELLGDGSPDDEDDEVNKDPKPADVVNTAVNTDLCLLDQPKSDRPAWKYWGRSRPEPQHRQPGNLKTNGSEKISPAGSRIGSPTNLSSVFHTLPVAKGQRLTVRDVLRHSDPGLPSGTEVNSELSVMGKSIPAAHT